MGYAVPTKAVDRKAREERKPPLTKCSSRYTTSVVVDVAVTRTSTTVEPSARKLPPAAGRSARRPTSASRARRSVGAGRGAIGGLRRARQARGSQKRVANVGAALSRCLITRPLFYSSRSKHKHEASFPELFIYMN